MKKLHCVLVSSLGLLVAAACGGAESPAIASGDGCLSVLRVRYSDYADIYMSFGNEFSRTNGEAVVINEDGSAAAHFLWASDAEWKDCHIGDGGSVSKEEAADYLTHNGFQYHYLRGDNISKPYFPPEPGGAG